MLSEILLYVDLLVFLAGALLYGYLARELLFRPGVLPGNYAIRGGLLCLAFFYLATLIDEQIYMLWGLTPTHGLGSVWDLLRALAWLTAFPFITQTLAISLRTFGDRPHPLLTLPGWLTLGAFAVPAFQFLEARSSLLAEATGQVYPWVVLHATVNLVLAGALAGRLARRMASAPAMVRLLAGMQAVLLGLAGFFVASYWVDPWGTPRPGAEAIQLLTRTTVMSSLLLPGFLMAVFVRRDNILRLSLSFRTLRHFLSVLLLVGLVMVMGPALGMADVQLYRRMVAWGLLLALFGGVFYRPVADALLRRFQPLRRLFGRDLLPAELEDLVDRLMASEASDEGLLESAAKELSQLLAVDARFLGTPAREPRTVIFWRHFRGGGDGDTETGAPPVREPIHRLDPADAHLAAALARQELQAVFPLRVDGELEGLLALSVADASPWAGGLEDGELEVVSLVVRQAAALLSSRRRQQSRLEEERRLAEQERLGLLGLVAASLAHEVKNPLSSMKILAQALKEDLAGSDPDGDGVADLEAILEQIDRLDQTTREILGVARPRPSACCDLSNLVRSAIYVIGADAKRRGVELTGRVDEVGQVSGSPASWQTVVFNMVLNAVQHTPAGERVAVRLLAAASNDNEWRFEVDNPAGDADSATAHTWFDPFITEGGTGLGLALVARRAEELGVRPEVTIEDGKARFRVLGTSIREVDEGEEC